MRSPFRRTLFSLFVLALVPLGCGSTASPGSTALGSDGGIESDSGDASPTNDASGNTSDGSACLPAPAVGTPCTVGQVACPIHVDACCGGVVPVCQGSPPTWMSFGVGCACRNTPCGDKSCNGNQVCKAQGPGTPGGSTTYTCEDMPAACAKEWTCACVKASLGASCTVSACDDTGNHVKVTCIGQ